MHHCSLPLPLTQTAQILAENVRMRVCFFNGLSSTLPSGLFPEACLQKLFPRRLSAGVPVENATTMTAMDEETILVTLRVLVSVAFFLNSTVGNFLLFFLRRPGNATT